MPRINRTVSHIPDNSGEGVCDEAAVQKLKNALGIMKTILFNLKKKNRNFSLENYIADMEHIISESAEILEKLRVSKPSSHRA